jgi:hypothetical protein
MEPFEMERPFSTFICIHHPSIEHRLSFQVKETSVISNKNTVITK